MAYTRSAGCGVGAATMASDSAVITSFFDTSFTDSLSVNNSGIGGTCIQAQAQDCYGTHAFIENAEALTPQETPEDYVGSIELLGSAESTGSTNVPCNSESLNSSSQTSDTPSPSLPNTSSKIPVLSSRASVFNAAVSAIESHVSGAVGIPVLSYFPPTIESVPDIFQMLFSPPTTPEVESEGNPAEIKESLAPAINVTPVQKKKPRKNRAKPLTPKPLSELMQPYVEMEMMARPFIPDECDNFASAFAPWERSASVTLF